MSATSATSMDAVLAVVEQPEFVTGGRDFAS